MKPDNQDQKIRQLFLKLNRKRMLYASAAGIVVTLIHIIDFFYKLVEPGTEKYIWQVGIILSHVVLLTVFVFMGVFVTITRKSVLESPGVHWTIFYLTQFIILYTGVGLTVIDQLVINTVTPFIILSFAIAILFLMHPFRAVLLFLTAFLLLYFALPITQNDPDVLHSLRVNALSIAAISILLSIMFWRTNKTKYRQSLVIEDQKRELEQANADLQEQARELLDINETKDKFFSIIAHDLKSPFNAVMGFSDLLAENVKDKNFEGIEKYVSNIQKSSYLAMDLLNNLMDWARSQTGRMAFEPEKLRLLPVVNESVSYWDDAAHAKSITIAKEIPESASVYADKQMLNSILHNLISNAIKFTPRGGKVSIKSDSLHDETKISVTDTGMGIDKQMLADLFNIDKNTGRQGTEGEPSTGLGLYICKEFAERHNGRIWVESREGKGSAFFVSLPA